MSAFNIKSTVLAARDATPKVLSDAALAGERERTAYGCQKVSDAGTDLNTAGTKIRLIQVPSSARITQLEYVATSCGTGVIDVAVWYPTYVPQGGGNFLASSVAATLISSSVFLANINVPDTNQAFTTALPAVTTLTMQKLERPLWEILGLASDPEMNLDMGFTVRAACAINGYVGLRARYTT